MRGFAFLLVGVCVLCVPACTTDHGLGPTVQGIRGNVYFVAAWPDSILEVRVAVFERYPVESFLDLSGVSDPLPLLSDSAAYEVELPPGEYHAVAAVCRTTPEWNADCILGFHSRKESPDLPGSVTVPAGTFVGSIHVVARFGGAVSSKTGR